MNYPSLSALSAILNVVFGVCLIIVCVKYRRLIKDAKYMRGRSLRLKHLTPDVNYHVLHAFRSTNQLDGDRMYVVLQSPNWKTRRVVEVKSSQVKSNHPLVAGDVLRVEREKNQIILTLVKLCAVVM
jgi:hypothetical protein